MSAEPSRPTMSELKALVLKKKEAWISRVFYRKLSVPITWALVRTRATPNGVTWFSVLVGLAALACLASPMGQPWIRVAGFALFQLAIVLDHVDGELARAKQMSSPGGLFLDNFAMEVVLHLGLAAAAAALAYRDTGDSRWLFVGAAFFFAKAVNLATYQMRAIISLKHPVSSGPGGAAPARRRLLHLLPERYWEVKKMANLVTVLGLADLAWRLSVPAFPEFYGWPVSLLGAYVALGVPLLATATLLDAWSSSRGSYFVDLEPYK